MIYLLKNAIVNGFIRLFSDGTSKKWEVVLKIAIQQPAGFFFWSLRALWLAGNFQLGKRSQKLRGIPQASDPNWPWKIVEKWSLCLPLPQVTCLFFLRFGDFPSPAWFFCRLRSLFFVPVSNYHGMVSLPWWGWVKPSQASQHGFEKGFVWQHKQWIERLLNNHGIHPGQIVETQVKPILHY